MALSTLPQLPSLSDAINGANALDAQANRYQGISDSFKEGQLTPLTAIAKGLSSAVASGKSEKAAAARDAAQARLNQIQELRSQMEQHQMEVKDRLLAEQEASATGEQLARAADQASVGDDTGIRNWLASNPQSAKVLSRELGSPVESMTFSRLNGVDVLIPYGRDAEGNMVTGQPKPLDDVLKAYAPQAYAARYATRQANALAEQQSRLNEAKITTQEAQARNYDAQAEAKANPAPKVEKPLPQGALKIQDEALSSIGSFAGLNADIDGLTKMIDEGKLDTSLRSRAGASIRETLNRSTEEDRNLSTLDSKLEGLRNGILLLAKGVQTDGDALRAFNEITKNKNDTALVRQRLQDIKVQNERNAMLQQARIDSLRNEYGKEPMDYSAISKQPAAVGTGKAANPYANMSDDELMKVIMGGQ
ncbi:hypothetical protein [Rhizobium sp. Nf11,1]|uniref:hypothetical protein n=1 Tax=Rhizobium sp. Nf11,1 TaxID=3404923 RepID=UPI003D336BE3